MILRKSRMFKNKKKRALRMLFVQIETLKKCQFLRNLNLLNQSVQACSQASQYQNSLINQVNPTQVLNPKQQKLSSDRRRDPCPIKQTVSKIPRDQVAATNQRRNKTRKVCLKEKTNTETVQ